MNIDELPFISELNSEQKAAVTSTENTVVSAGAGSGKTKVLCARYAHLIMSGICEVDEILTITFTNKAANEMYRRIYALLSEHAPSNEYAKKAMENFHKAWISTLDSFCLGVARNVSRRFGISPGFESNDGRLTEEARSLALRFVLDKRDDPALQPFIAERKMRETADELFVNPALYHNTLTSPLDFTLFEKNQKKELLANWKESAEQVRGIVELLAERLNELPEKLKVHGELSAALAQKNPAPNIETLFAESKTSAHKENNGEIKQTLAAYLDFLDALQKCMPKGSVKNDAALAVKEAIKQLREQYTPLLALANYAVQWNIVQKVFPLIAEYQEILNRKKREAGVLGFNDIAHMAVDGLRAHEDLRQFYRNSFKMIMIDEFQDNNSLQRDLIDLLENPAKVFYVGDEKQSIYRFRGADVSVFRSLAKNTERALSLNTNYRSRPLLIKAFNRVFGGYRDKDDGDPAPSVFPPAGTKTEDFQAAYCWIDGRDRPDKTDETMPCLHFAFFDSTMLEDNDVLGANDHEAFFIAKKISELYARKTMVRGKDGERPCAYGDFAVLLRSLTHQHSLERAFKYYNIPFNADRPASLFYDAPVNDLLAYLKLLVYPNDHIAYGALLRSPFVRLSEDAFTLCMLHKGTIFDEALDEQLSAADRFCYSEARKRYRELLADSGDLPVSSLITRLWYNEGYRHEALWSSSTQVYLDLYDLFFEQARNIEKRGGTLVDFLNYADGLVNKQEKPDDSVLPNEEGGGARVMTIHRAKGLEFPFVFVYNSGGKEQMSLENSIAYYSDRRGVFLKLPRAEEFPAAENYFYLAEKEENRAKTEAELRRLLYVAMTRAEHTLYVTGVLPKQNSGGEQHIVELFEQHRTNPKLSSISFLRLLPALSLDDPLYTVEAIPCHAYQAQTEKNCSLKETTLQVVRDYNSIPAIAPARFVPQIVGASGLHIDRDVVPRENAGAQNEVYSSLDEFLRQSGIEPAEFGTIVHGFIEAMFNDEEPKLPARFAAALPEKHKKALAEAARTMAEGFFNSPLGQRARAAAFRKTEYPILTAVQCGERRVLVSGTIDLVFDDGVLLSVVDFKTDRDEDISRHTGQLAVYKRAVEDIFGKPAACRLFYLRSGHEADVSEAAAQTSPEELVAAWEQSIKT